MQTYSFFVILGDLQLQILKFLLQAFNVLPGRHDAQAHSLGKKNLRGKKNLSGKACILIVYHIVTLLNCMLLKCYTLRSVQIWSSPEATESHIFWFTPRPSRQPYTEEDRTHPLAPTLPSLWLPLPHPSGSHSPIPLAPLKFNVKARAQEPSGDK